MKKYTFKFTGREVSAIGKTYKITATVEATNLHDATMKLYEKYDHCTGVTHTVKNIN
jgi:hypothetical protein